MLWAADKMRSYMDPAEYKRVVLGLIFLKYVSDAFEEKREQLELFTADPTSDLYVKEPGKGGGEFYSPRSVVDLLVEMIEPYKGHVYDPCCGSGSLFHYLCTY